MAHVASTRRVVGAALAGHRRGTGFGAWVAIDNIRHKRREDFLCVGGDCGEHWQAPGGSAAWHGLGTGSAWTWHGLGMGFGA